MNFNLNSLSVQKNPMFNSITVITRIYLKSSNFVTCYKGNAKPSRFPLPAFKTSK